jgi:hypothetical protein
MLVTEGVSKPRNFSSISFSDNSGIATPFHLFQ